MATLYQAKEVWTGTLASAIPDGTTTSFTLTSSSGLINGKRYLFTIDRVDASGTKTPSKKEVIAGTVSGSNVIDCIRGVEGTAQAHSSGAIVEVLFNAKHWNELVDYLETEHNTDGTHKSALVTTLKATGSSINAGLEDDRIVTPKAIKDAGLPYEGEASGSDVDTGTNQTKYVSSKAIADSKIVSTAKAIENNEAIQQKDSGGTARDIIKVNSSDDLIIGSSSLNGISFYPRSCFSAANNQTQTIPHNTYTKVAFQQVIYDLNSEYSNTNYRFTAKSGGLYLFHSQIMYSNISSSEHVQVFIYKNGQQIYLNGVYIPSFTGIQITGVLQLNPDDYVEIYTRQFSGANRTIHYDSLVYVVYFMGIKIL